MKVLFAFIILLQKYESIIAFIISLLKYKKRFIKFETNLMKQKQFKEIVINDTIK